MWNKIEFESGRDMQIIYVEYAPGFPLALSELY